MADGFAAGLPRPLGHDLCVENLRLRMQNFSEDEWLAYSANLRTRPIMPDFAVRDMTEEDRRALYRFIRGLGPAG